MCFTCSAKVRTPLNSPLVGAKEYLSSGIASAAETKSFSISERPLFKTCAIVSGEPDFAAWPQTNEYANSRNSDTQRVVILLIESSVYCETIYPIRSSLISNYGGGEL